MEMTAGCLVVVFPGDPAVRFACTLAILSLSRIAFASDPAIVFFETQIRPVLAEHCFSCHSAKAASLKGGLKLDSAAGIKSGGDSGAIVVAGKPKDSLLIKAIRHVDEVSAMPPKGGKLPASVIADFERWIASGAAMPADVAVGKPTADPKSHWAFQPLRPRGPNDTIDSLIAVRRTAAGLAASPPADRRTLLRRVSIDLTGLPPTWDEIQSFERDPSPNAYRDAVERMLASPRYAERWARHWLDVARYADTKDGVLQYGADRIRPFAYTYRDYVVQAFQDDLPIDQFLKDQIAADLQPGLPRWRLAALGFLTLGRIFDNNDYDIIDDRIDTVSRGMLGLTVSCARCHDHKFDPIPTADYYSLYGVFSGCRPPVALPLIDPAARGPKEYEAKYLAATADLERFTQTQYDFLLGVYRNRTGDYLERIVTTPPDPIESANFFFSFAPDELRPPLVRRWRLFIAKHAVPGDRLWGPWAELMAIPPESLAAEAVKRVAGYRTPAVHPAVVRELAAGPVKTRADIAQAYGRVLTTHHRRFHVLPAPPMTAEDREIEALFTGPAGPAFFPIDRTAQYASRKEADAFGSKRQAIDKLAVNEPQAPPRAMVVEDLPEVRDPVVLIRGNPSRPGVPVKRQFLAALTDGERKPFGPGSGRLDLAHAIVAHPLTSRVFVNRIWMHHFGEPLVDTPGDFGIRTARPVQAELLDHLAATLIQSKWSLKALHRVIVMSDTYRQSSADRDEGRRIDPDNRLYWRANRRRLDFESMRDGMLFAAGRLVETVGGRPRDVISDPADTRRSIYALVDRQSLPGVFRAFDFAVPDQSVDRRPMTTVPQQALFGLNSPFVLAQAQALADRADVRGALDPQAKVRAMYRHALAREPDDDELSRAVTHVTRHSAASLAQVLLLANEFHFTD
jgi:mono/diheme cytochrome c family protein